MKETEIASLDPSSADYETKKTRLEGELAALTKTAGEKLAALNEARPKWQEQETAALYLQKGNAEADADAIAIGTNARAGIKNSIALGKDAQTGDLAESSIAIGEGAVTGKDAVRAIAIGKGSTVKGADSIAVGHGHTVNGKNSGTFGDPNVVNADNTYVVGNNSTVEENITNAFVFGNDVTVNNGTLPDGWYTLSDDDKANQTGYGVIAIGNNVTASLNAIYAKIGQGGTTAPDYTAILNAILDKLDGMQKDNNKNFAAILNAIGNIDIKPQDLSWIKGHLDAILEAIKDHDVVVTVEGGKCCCCKDGGIIHEGVLGDLNDLLG